MPGSRFEVFDGAGHMPHHDDPERFAAILADFCADTEPARLDDRPLAPAALARQLLLERLHRREQVAQRRPPAPAPRSDVNDSGSSASARSETSSQVSGVDTVGRSIARSE